MFVRRGDRMMPSVALVAARFASLYGIGKWGETLFANTVVDPAKRDSKNLVVYFDSDDQGREGGCVRTLAGSPTWYVDRLLISSQAADSSLANSQLREHINFLCSVRSHPVFCDDDKVWYRFLHFALLGRTPRPGRSSAGLDLYEAALRVMWRPLSADDPDYAQITGIGSAES